MITESQKQKILKAINDLQTFLECDIWYAKEEEWKTEDKMLDYIREHFDICKEQIREVFNNETSNTNSNSSNNS